MARGDYTGVPDTAPSLEASNDVENIQVPAGAFGEGLGEGLQHFGESLLKTSQFYGQVAADSATNNFLEQSNKILYGDPAKSTPGGPNGAALPDTGYFGLRGADAMRARPEVQQQLDDLIAEQRENLQTPRAREQYDIDTRRYRAQTLAKVSEHADAQQKTWATDTNTTTAQIGLNGASRVAADDAAVAPFQEQVRNAHAKNAQLAGLDPQGAVLKADQDVAQARIRALVVSDPASAQRVLDANRDVLGSLPNYDQIARAVKGAVVDSQRAPFVDSVVADALTAAQAQKAAPSGTTPTGTPSGAHIAAPSGGVYDQIGQVAAAHGATPEEVAYLKQTARIESSGNPNAPGGGLFQLRGNLAAQGGADVGQQTAVTLQHARENGRILTDAGVRPTGADLYLMHQQGPAAGKALLTAPPDVGAVAALAPAYHGNTAEATQAIAGNIGLPYHTPQERATANARAEQMTAGDFVGLWRGRFGGGSGTVGGGSAQYSSTADYLRANMPQILANARQQAEAKWPNYPDVQDAVMQETERRLNQTISQQDQQYLVDTHTVQTAIAQHNPVSESDLRAISPQVANAWDAMQTENPLAYDNIQRRFEANSHGRADSFGFGFSDYLSRALAPSTDPNRITNPAQLNGFVGAGKNALLTNTGVDAISNLISVRGTPQGEAFASQARTLLSQMHGDITFSSANAAQFDPKGEERFSEFAAVALPIMLNAYKSGNVNAVLDPKSPDYLGNIAQHFMRTPAEMMKDRIADDPMARLMAEQGNEGDDARYMLKAAVASGRLSRIEAQRIGEESGWFSKGLPPAPGPAPRAGPLQAPAPQPEPVPTRTYPLPPGYTAPH